MSRRYDTTSHFGRLPHASAVSGRRPRVVPPSSESEEEFAEPDLALVSLAEERAVREHPAGPAVELAEARGQVAERDRLIESLTLRVAALESELASLRALRVDVEEIAEVELCDLIEEPVKPEPVKLESATLAPTYAPIERISLRWSDSREPNGVYQRDVELVDDARLFADIAGDITQGGIFIATHVALPLGASVSVELEASDLGVLSVAGAVAWSRDQPDPTSERPGIGIAFSELPVDAATAIRSLFRDEPLFVEF